MTVSEALENYWWGHPYNICSEL